MLSLQITFLRAVTAERQFLSTLLKQPEARGYAIGYTPLTEYETRIKQKVLVPDVAQKRTMEDLEKLFETLRNYNPCGYLETKGGQDGYLSELYSDRDVKKDVNAGIHAPHGLYIYGSDGRGKKTLMDMFFECCTNINRKQRVHFNVFMNKAHTSIYKVKQSQEIFDRAFNSEMPLPFDPTFPVAQVIAAESWLICFDEFQVNDTADAMILNRLFTHLFNCGVVIVAMSKSHPKDLYKNGIHRSNFVPFINLLLNRCQVSDLDDGVGYDRITQSRSDSRNY